MNIKTTIAMALCMMAFTGAVAQTSVKDAPKKTVTRKAKKKQAQKKNTRAVTKITIENPAVTIKPEKKEKKERITVLTIDTLTGTAESR